MFVILNTLEVTYRQATQVRVWLIFSRRYTASLSSLVQKALNKDVKQIRQNTNMQLIRGVP